eukprot:Filipodium_phascolosomae@DN2337_c0_g1_i1.p1
MEKVVATPCIQAFQRRVASQPGMAGLVARAHFSTAAPAVPRTDLVKMMSLAYVCLKDMFMRTIGTTAFDSDAWKKNGLFAPYSLFVSDPSDPELEDKEMGFKVSVKPNSFTIDGKTMAANGDAPFMQVNPFDMQTGQETPFFFNIFSIDLLKNDVQWSLESAKGTSTSTKFTVEPQFELKSQPIYPPLLCVNAYDSVLGAKDGLKSIYQMLPKALSEDNFKAVLENAKKGNVQTTPVELPAGKVVSGVMYVDDPQLAAGSAVLSALTAPMNAKVIAIKKKAGDEVQEGESVLVLEAMKMEMVVASKVSGVVKMVMAAKGQSMNHGDVLAYIEPK